MENNNIASCWYTSETDSLKNMLYVEYKISLLGSQSSNIYLYIRLFHYIWIFIFLQEVTW